MISRGQNFKSIPLNLVGSSVFGRYPKISIERTQNMFISDNFLVPYPGYKIAVAQSMLGTEGRAIHTSTKFNRLVVVVDEDVFLVNIFFDFNNNSTQDISVVQIGSLNTTEGPVYIAENNKPQIAFSDGENIYIYDPTLSPAFQQIPINFTPGYITFHDTYFIAAASNDQTYNPPANNTWRLSAQNDGTSWPSVASSSSVTSVGLIQSKPDNTQAVIKPPSGGNMIFVLGSTVTEVWFDTGAQTFPYQRNNQITIDYGCISPATVASNDQYVVWLAQNEKTGPIIMYSDGGLPQKITTDGIDYLFSTLTAPEDSRAFMFRQQGHTIYHINFFTDNLSLFYDFNTQKFYNASDENLNYFIGSQLAFFNNQYYFITPNNGNIYAFSTVYTTYDGAEIPRFRACRNIRLPSQEYFVINDVGFTIESGETDWQIEDVGELDLITQDGQLLITQGSEDDLITQDSMLLVSQNSINFSPQQVNPNTAMQLIAQQDDLRYFTPRVDLSISYDGGATFGNDMPYVLPSIGQRRNKLLWWQCGIANDAVMLFKFWGLNTRVVATDGIVNIRQ